jgi:hypothetical protein
VSFSFARIGGIISGQLEVQQGCDALYTDVNTISNTETEGNNEKKVKLANQTAPPP